MSYTLHGARGSGSSIVEAACAVVGVDVQVRDLDARNHEQRGDAYAAINPHRKMPTLEIDGELLTESAAIVITLDERHPDAGLLPPPGSKARAQALRWLLFCASELYPIIEIIDYPERFAPSGEASAAVGARARELWLDRWRTLESQIGGAPYLLEEGFTATDLYVFVLSRWDMSEAWRREHLPRVDALAAAVRARPELAAVWARHFPPKSSA